MRDGLGLIKTSAEIEGLAREVPDHGGVYFVPALTGLGSPYWDPNARGLICGLTRGSNRGHLARATLEGIAYQNVALLEAMQKDSQQALSVLKVDGGASANALLMQIQADLLQRKIIRPKSLETTAIGCALLAGLALGIWQSLEEIESKWQVDSSFDPIADENTALQMKFGWKKAVAKALLH